jgi:hypothetical protein
MGLGFYLYPLATSFWELFLFRVVYAVGAAASSAMITAGAEATLTRVPLLTSPLMKSLATTCSTRIAARLAV